MSPLKPSCSKTGLRCPKCLIQGCGGWRLCFYVNKFRYLGMSRRNGTLEMICAEIQDCNQIYWVQAQLCHSQIPWEKHSISMCFNVITYETGITIVIRRCSGGSNESTRLTALSEWMFIIVTNMFKSQLVRLHVHCPLKMSRKKTRKSPGPTSTLSRQGH